MKAEISAQTETLFSFLVLSSAPQQLANVRVVDTREKSSKQVKHARIQTVRHASAACVRSPGLREKI
eukprot:COSAG01_NODE_494_length_16322_cov_35.380879_17_plen_67_part_00